MPAGTEVDRVCAEKDRGSIKIMKLISNLLKKILVLLVRFYQICISPLLPRTCRFYPTCSTYFIQALEKYGPFKGTYLGIRRIMRCHPWNEGGYDPLE